MILTVVCKHCYNSNNDEGSIEINFRDGCIYYICPVCKKENKLNLAKKEDVPLAKPRTLGR